MKLSPNRSASPCKVGTAELPRHSRDADRGVGMTVPPPSRPRHRSITSRRHYFKTDLTVDLSQAAVSDRPLMARRAGVEAAVGRELLQISRAIQTAPREAERTRQACGIRTP